MRQLLADWLPPNEARPEQLADWLRGRRLPPVGDDDEPYVWILRGLPKGAGRPAAEKAIAETLAKLLGDGIDRANDARVDKMLYNLFMLAAAVSWPDALCDPLDEAVRRQSLTDRSWLRRSLPDALRAAVIENQLDARHEAMWQSMLAGNPHPYLGGSPTSGFDGVLWMPESPQTRGRPALGAIGRALRRMTHVIDNDPELHKNCDVEFRSYLARVRNAYPGAHQVTDDSLMAMAEANQWPSWAWYSLVALIAPKPDPGLMNVVMPAGVAAALGTTTVVGRYCRGRVVIAKVPPEQLGRVDQAIQAEAQRRSRLDLGPILTIRQPKAPDGSEDSTVRRYPAPPKRHREE